MMWFSIRANEERILDISDWIAASQVIIGIFGLIFALRQLKILTKQIKENARQIKNTKKMEQVR